MSIVGETKYESVITEGEFETRISEKSHATTGSQVTLGAQIKSDLTMDNFSTPLSISARAKYERARTSDSQTTTLTKPEIFEVQAVPHGWRVGHKDYGDPSKSSRFLDGRYFDRYVPEFPYTCEFEFLGAQTAGRIVFLVTVRDGLRVHKDDGEVLSRDQISQSILAMQDRIAALRVERYLDNTRTIGGEIDTERPILVAAYEVEKAVEVYDPLRGQADYQNHTTNEVDIDVIYQHIPKRPE